ncbi:MAG: hypothetical protein AAB548_00200 [Patescibacteria group bacterium]
MARNAWREGLALTAISGMLISCGNAVDAAAVPTGQPVTEEFTPGEDDGSFLEATPWPTSTVPPIEFPTVLPAALPTEILAFPTEERLINPYFNHPFSQRCRQWFDEANKYVVECSEDWAERPLPGGCEANRFNDFMGRPSCNAAAASFVINYLVPAEEIYARTGFAGIAPDQLAWDIYPNLPPTDGQIIMDCGGAGPASIRGALRFFGLSTEEPMLSKYTLVRIGESLAPNQRLMIAMIGINAKGRRFQHWTVYKRYEVASGGGYAEYSGLIPYFDDSFFYQDQITPEDVDFEVSPNIGERADGTKNFEIVGAFIVTSPYDILEWYIGK